MTPPWKALLIGLAIVVVLLVVGYASGWDVP